MIHNILTQSAVAFRGHAPSGTQERPQHLALSNLCVDKLPFEDCDANAWEWACDAGSAKDDCTKMCYDRKNEKGWTTNKYEYILSVCEGGGEPPATQAPPATPPVTQAPPATPPVTQAPPATPPATQAPPATPPATLAPVPCVPVTDDPVTVAPPATPAPIVPPGQEHSVDGYVPFVAPPRNNSQNYTFSAFASGQAGNSDYASMMGVSSQELVGGVMPFNDLANQKKSDCMWCDNLWSLEWNGNKQESSNVLNGNSFKTHTEYRNVSPTKMNYNDYSASSAQDDYIVGAYVTEWSVYRATGKYGIDAVPFNAALDYVLYGFMPVCGLGSDGLGQLGLCTVQDCSSYAEESNSYFALNQACDGVEPGTIVIHDPWSAFSGYSSMMTILQGFENNHPKHMGGFHLLMNAKAEHKEKIRIMPSIGGWSLSKIFFDMNDEKIRHNFVNSAANLLTAWPFFDGIDIDWEFPGGLGADAGLVKFAKAGETDIRNESWSPHYLNPDECVLNSVNFTEKPRTVYTSWKNMISCDRFNTKEVVTVDIPPLGCSHSRAKRQEIADSYKSWGSYGSKTKEDYMNCQCDDDIGYMVFSDLRTALDNVPLSERPAEFGKIDRYQITTATSGAPDKINEVDYGRLVAEGKLDHIFIMSYDFMGAWSNQVGHQTNLFHHQDGEATPVSIHQSVQAYLTQGVPSDKILVGVASYGRGWKGNFSSAYANGDLAAAWNTPASGACDGDIEDGVVDYNTIYEKTTNGTMKQIWDDCAMAHLTVGSDAIYTGDSAESIWAKGDFVKKNKLAGLFTWELSQDSHQAPLLNAMNEALGRTPSSGSVQKPAAQYSDISNSRCNAPLEFVNYSERSFNITCEK